MDVPEDELAEEAELLDVEDEIAERLRKEIASGRRKPSTNVNGLELELVEE